MKNMFGQIYLNVNVRLYSKIWFTYITTIKIFYLVTNSTVKFTYFLCWLNFLLVVLLNSRYRPAWSSNIMVLNIRVRFLKLILTAWSRRVYSAVAIIWVIRSSYPYIITLLTCLIATSTISPVCFITISVT